MARVQHVGAAPLALLLPHEVGAGREEWPRALAVQLQDGAAHGQRHPHSEHAEVWRRERRREGAEGAENTRLALCDLPGGGLTLTDGLEGHVSEGGAVVVVEQTLEHVEHDVGEAGVHVGVDG